MSVDITLDLPIAPVPKGRPRAAVVNGHARLYTPKRTARFEAELADLAAMRLPPELLEGPLRVDILAVLPRPKRLMRRKDSDGLLWAPKRPDADNIRKAVLDGLARHWRDDSQVCDGRTVKVYAERSGLPRTVIRIRSLEGADPTEADLFAGALG